MIYQEGIIKVLSSPIKDDFDDNHIMLSKQHLQHTPTSIIDDSDETRLQGTQQARTSSAPPSWPRPPVQHALVPKQQPAAYPGSDQQDDEEVMVPADIQEGDPVTPRDGISFTIAEGTTPEHVAPHEHCQHYPNWTTQAAPTRIVPVRDIPRFPETHEHGRASSPRSARSARFTPYDADSTPPRSPSATRAL